MLDSWIDTHCHLDASEFDADRDTVRHDARLAGVGHCVIPAVAASNWKTVRDLAHQFNDSYCLGIHPLYVDQATEDDLVSLEKEIQLHIEDARLVAVGEIGLDYFVPALTQSPLREKQEFFYRQQLQLAAQFELPVVLHVRRSADRLLKYLREVRPKSGRWSGIAHAFNGSEVQAQAFIDLGFKLGFGGAVTFERALQLRHLAKSLPLDAMVVETDAPDIAPHWLYATALLRSQGTPQGRNAPSQIPQIAEVIAQLRGISVQELKAATTFNAQAALPRLAALL
jgi:TatD DNase family protein